LILSKIVKIIAIVRIKGKNSPNSILAGAVSQTAMEELTALPQAS